MELKNMNEIELKLLKARIERYTNYTKETFLGKRYEAQIEEMKNNGIYLNRQFEDAENGLNSREYNRWLKEARDTFFHTIHARSLMCGNDYKLKIKHSKDELYMPVLKGYTPNQIINTLKLLIFIR